MWGEHRLLATAEVEQPYECAKCNIRLPRQPWNCPECGSFRVNWIAWQEDRELVK